MSLVFTMPGKIGDALLQWPVVFHYCRQQELKCTLWLDEKTLKPLVPLFEAQPCVEKVQLRGGIEHYRMGGQPYDFGLKTADHIDHEVYHLGFRHFPTRQITLETLENVPLHIDGEDVVNEPSLTVGPTKSHGAAVLHGTFSAHGSGTPAFWRFLYDIKDDLPADRCFIGKPSEVKRALELYPWRAFDDGGNFLELARFMQGASIVIGSGSCGVALAGLLKVPCIRVHDAIGEMPKVIWSNLGENQINETEKDLRKLWPEIRDKWLTKTAS
jgi:hypothetical protein